MGWIVREISSRGGAISFRELMELALYHGKHGYYGHGTRRQGRSGDYLTAPTASSWYAATFARLGQAFGSTVRFVDVGSGDGTFLADVVTSLPADPPDSGIADLFSVERSKALRDIQSTRFTDGGVTILPSIDELPTTAEPTLVHASELYDAFPVHRVVRRADGLRELGVRVSGQDLEWFEAPADAVLGEYLGRHGVTLQSGQIAEINLEAETFHRRLLEIAGHAGLAIIVDYGYPALRLYDPRGRRRGSLACFHDHTLNRDPLRRLGEQDITAHVNWDDLRRAATDVGWTEIGLWPLAELLVRAGLQGVVEARGLGPEREPDAESYAERQEIKRLLDPDGMGTDLKALVQAGPAAAETARNALDPPL